jgi:hypothetical protein
MNDVTKVRCTNKETKKKTPLGEFSDNIVTRVNTPKAQIQIQKVHFLFFQLQGGHQFR